MSAVEIIARIQEEQKKAEEARIEEASKTIEEYLKTHPDGQPEDPIEDLDSLLAYLQAVRYLESVFKKRKAAADTDALIAVIRSLSEELDEDIDDSKVM